MIFSVIVTVGASAGVASPGRLWATAAACITGLGVILLLTAIHRVPLERRTVMSLMHAITASRRTAQIGNELLVCYYVASK